MIFSRFPNPGPLARPTGSRRLTAFALCLLLAGLFAPLQSTRAIGSLGLGFHTGFHPNPNNIMLARPLDAGASKTTGEGFNAFKLTDTLGKTQFYNKMIATSSGKGEQLAAPLGLSLGIHLRYTINSLFLRTGLEQSTLIVGKSGSFTPSGGKKNTITFQSDMTQIPITLGFLVRLTEFSRFYMGLGPMYANSKIKITHSNPDELKKGLPATEKPLAFSSLSYGSDSLGYHYLVGMEIPLSKRLTFSFEWMGFGGRGELTEAEITDENGDTDTLKDSEGQFIYIDGYKTLFSLNYLFYF